MPRSALAIRDERDIVCMCLAYSIICFCTNLFLKVIQREFYHWNVFEIKFVSVVAAVAVL